MKVVGVYSITNLVDGRIYVGQSWNVKKRWENHRNGSSNLHLSRAIKKLGVENFRFEILKEFSGPVRQDELDAAEVEFIERLGTLDPVKGYNFKEGGSNGRHLESTLKVMSESRRGPGNPMYGKRGPDSPNFGRGYVGERNPFFGNRHSEEFRSSRCGPGNPMFGRTGEKHPRYGKKHSEEFKASRRGAGNPMFGRCGAQSPSYGRVVSDETRKKMSEAAKNRKKKNQPKEGA